MTETNNKPIIHCEDVHKWFGDFHALKGIDMQIKPTEVIVIFGPSGSGKSTFIRTLNRLEEHQQGQIVIDGIELSMTCAISKKSVPKPGWSSSSSIFSPISA